MPPRRIAFVALLTFLAARSVSAVEPDPTRFQLRDVFSLEFAADPQVSPDGTQIVYVRNFFDIMTDRPKSNLWIVSADGSDHRPLTTGNRNDTSPRWSPDGGRLLYASNENGKTQLFCRWMDGGDTARLTNLTSAPASLEWSRDGRWIAFTMHVPEKPQPYVELPEKPEGAEWAAPFKVVRQTLYRHDGDGYRKDGFHHLFVLPAEGGTPRQLTSGDFDHQSRPAWSANGKSLIISS